jgi:molecular chaperone HscB
MADPFDTLGLKATFDLDAAAIRRAYLARVTAIHPDSAHGEDGRSSAMLNAAKRALEDDERRANALLARLGGPGKEQDRSLPAGFLVDVMELRERVEEAIASAEPGARERARSDALERRGAHIARVSELFASLATPPDRAGLGAIRTELNAWRYVERLIEQLDPAYDPSRADFSA